MSGQASRFAHRSGLAASVRTFVLCGALLGFSAGLSAQDQGASESSAEPTQRSVRTSEAVALALAGRSGDAETALATSLRHAPDSALGRLELASRLVRVAIECSANGKTETAEAFASRALEHLAATRRLATEREGGAVASAWQLEGFIQLDFRGDRQAALAAYREAAALAPDNDLVRRRVDRLEKELAPAAVRDAEVTP